MTPRTVFLTLSNTMTVSASHLTFCDFGFDGSPGATYGHHLGNMIGFFPLTWSNSST